MKRIAWATDIHLNFTDTQQLDVFCHQVHESTADALLLSGDIAEANSLYTYLCYLEEHLQLPIYFVLGNHDYYYGSIAKVRQDMARLSQSSPFLKWLPECGLVQLNEQTALLGHDGWADGRCGDYAHSEVMLTDYFLIQELAWLNSDYRLEVLHFLGDEAAAFFQQRLPAALSHSRYLIILTHVPPFRESCWHQGKISSDDWLPHFTCQAVGDVLRSAMAEHPEHRMTVLCGHTHGSGVVRVLPNLEVRTGGADYGDLKINDIITI